jgi:hypothetical protein
MDTYNDNYWSKKWLMYNEAKRTQKPTVTWIWGASGSGKTRHAHSLATSGDIYLKTNKWWDGYEKQETVILDDFRSKQIPFTSLLHLLDRYEHRVEIRWGSRQFDSPNIIITSIHPPEKVYKFESQEEVKQLLRRIDHIIHKI